MLDKEIGLITSQADSHALSCYRILLFSYPELRSHSMFTSVPTIVYRKNRTLSNRRDSWWR